jgi:hypothetical protein
MAVYINIYVKLLIYAGGEGGIRTPGRGFGPYNGLANRPIKPLWHLSSNVSNTLAQFWHWLGAL